MEKYWLVYRPKQEGALGPRGDEPVGMAKADISSNTWWIKRGDDGWVQPLRAYMEEITQAEYESYIEMEVFPVLKVDYSRRWRIAEEFYRRHIKDNWELQIIAAIVWGAFTVLTMWWKN